MKIQDLVFVLILAVLLWGQKFRMMVIIGLGFLILAMPLFYLHIFFTAERLTWYASFFFLIYLLHMMLKRDHQV